MRAIVSEFHKEKVGLQPPGAGRRWRWAALAGLAQLLCLPSPVPAVPLLWGGLPVPGSHAAPRPRCLLSSHAPNLHKLLLQGLA